MSGPTPPPGGRELEALVEDVGGLLKRGRRKLSPDVLSTVSQAHQEARELVRSAKGAFDADLYARLERLRDAHLETFRKGKFREYFESISSAILFALILRAFVVEAFQIPTGSMEPTLLVGDHLFVAKYAYGVRLPFTTRYLVRWGQVERGDIVVFQFPVEEVRTQAAIGTITRWIEQYRSNNGGYPPSLEALVDPATGRGLSEEARRDAWGNPFVYRPLEDRYQLRSAGADGVAGTGDDITESDSAFVDGVGSCLDQDSLRAPKDYIKRIVGLPGDTVELRDDALYVNGELVPQTDEQVVQDRRMGRVLARTESLSDDLDYTIHTLGARSRFGPVTVREGHVLAMGDNRDNSSDGRCWGQVPIDNIKGTAMFIFFSRDRNGTGDVRWSRLFGGIR